MTVFFLWFNYCNISLSKFYLKKDPALQSAANNPLLSSQNESDSVLNRTDEATDPIPDGEGRDVLTDMPRDDSAVNRFNKFLKERKDSELRNLMALRQGIDDRYLQDTGDIKVGVLFPWAL